MAHRDDDHLGADGHGSGPAAIVVGVDGSDRAWRAAAYGAGLARRQQHRCRVVFVYVGPAPGRLALVPELQPADASVVSQVADTIRTVLSDALTDGQLDWEFRVRRGSVYGELMRVALSVRADAVVVGASAGFWHRFTGSTAVRLVKRGLFPVIVVP